MIWKVKWLTRYCMKVAVIYVTVRIFSFFQSKQKEIWHYSKNFIFFVKSFSFNLDRIVRDRDMVLQKKFKEFIQTEIYYFFSIFSNVTQNEYCFCCVLKFEMKSCHVFLFRRRKKNLSKRKSELNINLWFLNQISILAFKHIWQILFFMLVLLLFQYIWSLCRTYIWCFKESLENLVKQADGLSIQISLIVSSFE